MGDEGSWGREHGSFSAPNLLPQDYQTHTANGKAADRWTTVTEKLPARIPGPLSSPPVPPVPGR